MLYRPMTNGQEKHVVIPKFRDPLKEPRPHWEWVGYHVHARCWELLLYHELGAFTERNLSTVLAALRQSYMKRRRQSKIESPKMSLEGETSIHHLCIGFMLLMTRQHMACLYRSCTH